MAGAAGEGVHVLILAGGGAAVACGQRAVDALTDADGAGLHRARFGHAQGVIAGDARAERGGGNAIIAVGGQRDFKRRIEPRAGIIILGAEIAGTGDAQQRIDAIAIKLDLQRLAGAAAQRVHILILAPAGACVAGGELAVDHAADCDGLRRGDSDARQRRQSADRQGAHARLQRTHHRTPSCFRI